MKGKGNSSLQLRPDGETRCMGACADQLADAQ